MECFITQPVHEAAITFLNSHGIATRYASNPDMQTVIGEIGSADAVITRDLGLNRQAILAAPNLKIISCHGTGTNRIDVSTAYERNVLVTNTPGANSQSVAELTVGLMLASARTICEADQAVREGNWAFRYVAQGVELHGKTLGLIGFGAIAQKVATIAGKGLGMRCIAWSPSVPATIFAEHGVEQTHNLEDLLRTVDVVSIHRSGKTTDRPLINSTTLALMRPRAILVNVGRGFSVESTDLARALEQGHLHGAALDVLPQEPPAMDAPLLKVPSLILTPHLGGTTLEALKRLALICAHQVRDVLAGKKPDHLVLPLPHEHTRTHAGMPL
ncbi:hydroxyacid dehydrogenase [Acetobacter ghanensis]|uniref:hydroxyacid dehydrogenase n=1 Tax=Acetobacter ghanensis TaxID=431306 RepID=UPI003D348429